MGCQCCKTKEGTVHELTQRKLLNQILLYAVDINNPDKYRLAICRLSDFKYKEMVGYGRLGKVYRVVERRTSRSLAMKEVPKKHEIYRMEPRLEKEHIVLSKMKSRWLVEMFQCYETHHKRCMLLQFLPGPSLIQLVKSRAPSPHAVKIYAAEMLLAMNAVHSHGYIHRDIKLANFMLDHYGHVKLCDFGSCIRFLPTDIARKVFTIGEDVPSDSWIKARLTLIQELQYKPRIPHGTSYYCAPEVIRLATRKPCGSVYSYLCDYWSLGVCFYYLMFRKLPFFSDEKVQSKQALLNTTEVTRQQCNVSFGWQPTNDLMSPPVDLWSKLQAMVYDILPSTTTGPENSANEQFFAGAKRNLVVPSLILHCDKTLKFPKSKTIDEATVDLIRGLLRDETVRLGKNGVHEIVTHHFFSSINWQSVGIINTNFLHDQISVTDVNVHQSGFKTNPSFMVTRPTTDSLLCLVQASATSGLQNNTFRDDGLSARSGHCLKDRRTESVPASVSVALDTVGSNRSQTHVVCAEPQRNFQDKNESCMSFHPKGQTPRATPARNCK